MAILLDGNDGEVFPSWSTGTRPSAPQAGQTGYNGTLNTLETWNGAKWIQMPSFNVPAPSSSGNLMTSDGTNWISTTQQLTYGTTVSSASGTSATISGIPSWAKRITILVNGMTSATSTLVITFNSATTGYAWTQGRLNATGTVTQASASDISFQVTQNAPSTSVGRYTISLANASTYLYIIDGNQQSGTNMNFLTGRIALGSVLTSVTFSGVTFTAGELDVIYE